MSEEIPALDVRPITIGFDLRLHPNIHVGLPHDWIDVEPERERKVLIDDIEIIGNLEIIANVLRSAGFHLTNAWPPGLGAQK